jgi:muramoyltetrapeptide carboxypeptidase
MTHSLKQKVAPKLVKAPALKAGDRVGLICPASRPDSPAALYRAVKVVQEMGFRPVVGRNVLQSHGYMAGTDAERLDDLLRFWKDDTIAGIFSVTGGFGSVHLLPFLNAELFLSKPKIFVGGDDNTHLALTLNAISGLVTFVGPNLDQVKTKASFESLLAAVTSKESLRPITCVNANNEDIFSDYPYAISANKIGGRLLPGNLTAIGTLMGTPFESVFDQAILLLEDKNERNSTLDRWFTNLYVSGVLDKVAGVAFGQFENCGAHGDFSNLSLEELFGDRLKSLSKPFVFGFPFGQGADNVTVPVGVEAHLDTGEGRLDFTEPALC